MDSGQVFGERTYHIVHPEPWPTDQLIDLLDRYWKSRGYRVLRDNRDDSVIAALIVRDTSNQVKVGVKVYHKDSSTPDAYLVGNTDCVWPDGTPTPRS